MRLPGGSRRLSVCAVLLLGVLCPSLRAQEEPRWQYPLEVARSSGERPPWPMETFMTEAGTMGLVVFQKEAGTTLRLLKEGAAAWATIELGLAIPSRAALSGETARFFLAQLGDRKLQFVTVDIAKSAKNEVEIGGAVPSPPMFSEWVRDGKKIRAILGCERGQVLATSSDDDGKTWTELAEIATNNKARDDQICPPLFLTERGLHLVHVARDAGLVHKVSKDGGKTWEAHKAAPAVGGGLAPYGTIGMQIGKALHVFVIAVAGREAVFLHSMSEDAGEIWSPAAELGRTRAGDLSGLPSARGAAGSVFFAFTEPGQSDLHAKRGHLFRSVDGKTWKEEPFLAGVRGHTGQPAVWSGAADRALAAFSVGPEAEGGTRDFVLLVRAFERRPAPRALDAKEIAVAGARITELGSDDMTRRDDAASALVRMGEAVVPLLKEAAGSGDAEVAARAKSLIEAIRLRWPDPSKKPDWWERK